MGATQTQIAVVGGQSDSHVVRIQARNTWLALDLGELWAYRELLYFFVWRDIKVRYKQTVIGAAWAILQPVLTMIVFSLFFGKLAKIPSQGLRAFAMDVFCNGHAGRNEHSRGKPEGNH
jgi:lipopolysaccharide transport system permease protein